MCQANMYPTPHKITRDEVNYPLLEPAFLEMLIILLYITSLIASPPMWIMQWVLILGSCAYLTAAIRREYISASLVVYFCYASSNLARLLLVKGCLFHKLRDTVGEWKIRRHHIQIDMFR